MRIFFSNENGEIDGKNSVALDIISDKFVIAIRTNGLDIKSRITNEILEGCHIDLDFSGEGIKIEEKKC